MGGGMQPQGHVQVILNLIDYESLQLDRPRMAHDLPANGKRLIQTASGYRMTIKAGEVTYENGEFTGALPGRLLRGGQKPGDNTAEA